MFHVDIVYRARLLSRFHVPGSNGQGKAKEGLAFYTLNACLLLHCENTLVKETCNCKFVTTIIRIQHATLVGVYSVSNLLHSQLYIHFVNYVVFNRVYNIMCRKG